jgi:hypothetical protein
MDRAMDTIKRLLKPRSEQERRYYPYRYDEDEELTRNTHAADPPITELGVAERQDSMFSGMKALNLSNEPAGPTTVSESVSSLASKSVLYAVILIPALNIAKDSQGNHRGAARKRSHHQETSSARHPVSMYLSLEVGG